MSAIVIAERIRGALIGGYIGDALAMPVHWYYNLNQLREDFPGGIKTYEAPKATFRGSIMNLSNTGGGGRGSDAGTVVGDVILHGKRKYWKSGGSYHYHNLLKKGENTLDSLITRVLLKSIVEEGGSFNADKFRSDYIAFMTTPGTHNDTYAGTCHRMFFANWANGVPPVDCPDNDGHNVDAIDALMNVPVIVAKHALTHADSSASPTMDTQLKNEISACIAVIRKSSVLQRYAEVYGTMLLNVLKGDNLRACVQQAGTSIGFNVEESVRRSPNAPMTACYITSALPVLLHFAYQYAEDDIEVGLLASANAGGENVARGYLLGVLLGAAEGINRIPANLLSGLHEKDEVLSEINTFIGLLERREGGEL